MDERDDQIQTIYAVPELYERTLPPDERRRQQDAAYLRELADAGVVLAGPETPSAAEGPDERRNRNAAMLAEQRRRDRAEALALLAEEGIAVTVSATIPEVPIKVASADRWSGFFFRTRQRHQAH